MHLDLLNLHTHSEHVLVYRRRQDGRTVLKSVRGRGTVELDNRWVVPYNPALLRKYGAHINVEYCASVK